LKRSNLKLFRRNLTTSIIATGAVLFAAAAAFAADAGASAPEAQGSWSALIFYAINAAIFVAIIVHYARPAVRQLFAARAHQVRDRRARAETTLEGAELAARDAIHLLERLADEKARLLRELEAETVYQVKQIRDAAAEGLARILRDSELTVAAAAEDARRRTRAYLAGVAGLVARELIERSFTSEDQRRMLSGFADKLAAEARP